MSSLKPETTVVSLKDLPFNITFLDIEEYIKRRGLKPVRSSFTMEPGTTRFHPEGLYSEEVFGPVASEKRIVTPGYIELHTKVMQPKVYLNIVRLSKYYEKIMSGMGYAIFDEELGNFIQASVDDEGADTGFTFFINHLPKLKFPKSSSLARQDKVDELTKYKDVLLIDKCIVIPAGIRDYQIGANGRPSVDEINKLYVSLLSYSMVIPPQMAERSEYDNVRYAIQRKLAELYEHLARLTSGPSGGKNGYLSRKWGSRIVALGGRDVISASDMTGESVDDLQFHKINETKVPLFLAAKELEPAVIYQIRQIFLSHIMHPEGEQVSLIDPRTLTINYHPVRPAEKDMFLTPEGLTDFINSFRDSTSRIDPVVMYDNDDVEYWLYLVYDTGDKIFIFRNLDSFKQLLFKSHPELTFDNKLIRPLSRIELLSIATWVAAQGKHCTVTRYPVIGTDSIYLSQIHLVTTDPGRTVELVTEYQDAAITIGEYPVLGRPYVDSTVPHPSRLAGLGADHDGDTISVNCLLSNEANEEVRDYLNHPASVITTSGRLVTGFNTDLIKLVLFNMMKPPKD